MVTLASIRPAYVLEVKHVRVSLNQDQSLDLSCLGDIEIRRVRPSLKQKVIDSSNSIPDFLSIFVNMSSF